MKMGDRKQLSDLTMPASLGAAGATGGSDVHSRNLMDIFWRGRWLLLMAITASLVSAFIYLRHATPLFAASSRLYIEQTGPKIINDSVTGSNGAVGSSNYLTTQCELMRSAAILGIAAESPRLQGLKSFRGISNPIGAIRDALEVSIGKGNDLVSVSFMSPYPDEAAIVVNTVVDAYTTYNSNQKRSTAAEVLKILRPQKEAYEAELEKKLQAMLEFRKQNNTISFDNVKEHGDLIGQRVSSLTEALTAAQIETIDAKSRLELAKSEVADPLKLRQLMAAQAAGTGPNGPVGPGVSVEETQLRGQLVAAEMDVDAMLHGRLLMPNHPRVLEANAKVEYLRTRLGQITGVQANSLELTPNPEATPEKRFAQMYLASAEQRAKLAQLKEAELQKSFGSSLSAQQQAAVDSNNKIATYALMDSDFKRIEHLCDMLDSRMKEIHVTEDVGALNVSILEVARPALFPTKPEKARTLSMALMFGIALGSALSFVNAWLDQRLRSADEITACLSLPMLGAIPHMLGKLPQPIRGRKVHLEPTSDVAEAYRTVRTSLYFGVPDSKSKTLLITSPAPGDGKSTSASNLAIALAQAGQRTLIIDADFRKPTQHKIFDLPSDVGMSTVLSGKTSATDAVRPTGIKDLDLLCCGPIPSNPAEILNSQQFADIVNELAQRYDHVVLDSPPVMPVTDARILGAMADVTIIVLRAEKSTRRASQYSRDVLLSVGTNILGLVVNDVRRSRGRYGYGYYSGYYQYGYGEQLPADASAEDVPPSTQSSRGNSSGSTVIKRL